MSDMTNLTGSVTKLTQLDSSLTKEGCSADAKATGEAIKAVAADLANAEKNIAESVETNKKELTGDIETVRTAGATTTDELSALKNQVTNLVVNAGDTGDNAELVDIRVGANGETYATAGEAVRKQFEEASAGVTEVKSELSNTTGAAPILFVENYYINTNVGVGNEVDTTPVLNSSLCYAILECNDNDFIVLNGIGWTTGRLWAFIDENNKLISVSEQNIIASNLVVEIPQNAVKCIINLKLSSLGNCYVWKTVPVLKAELDSVNSTINTVIIKEYNKFEQGSINSQGHLIDNEYIMRSVDFIPLSSIKNISCAQPYYIYLYLYDEYGYYVGMVTGAPYEFPTETVNHNTIKADYPKARKVKIALRGSTSNPVTQDTIGNTQIECLCYKDIQNETVIVDINGNGDFTSILRALKETPTTTKVIVKQGVYDEIAEYEEYYGSDFWTNYSGYGGLLDDFLRGYFVSAGRVLQFESGAVVQFLYDGANSSVDQYFSPLASGYDATIIGGHIKYSHARYGLHDDAAKQGGTNIFDGIIFEGSDVYYGNHIGGGMGKANTYYLKNLVFIDDGMLPSWGDFYYHNNLDASAENRIFVQNCYGERSATFRWFGNSEKTTYCVVSNCKFKSIKCIAHSIEPNTNENMKLIEFNNTVELT